jgi:hypothetical protein
VNANAGTDVMILKYFRRKKMQKIVFFVQHTANFCKNLIVTLVFEKNAKLAKIAENCDHNIDPCCEIR